MGKVKKLAIFLSLIFFCLILKSKYGIFKIISGSMYPELQIGDIVITQKNDDYNIGEIITFNVNKQYLITHRIVGKQEGGFITKGDNNNTEDIEKVIKEDIEGKVIYNLKILRKFN